MRCSRREITELGVIFGGLLETLSELPLEDGKDIHPNDKLTIDSVYLCDLITSLQVKRVPSELLCMYSNSDVLCGLKDKINFGTNRNFRYACIKGYFAFAQWLLRNFPHIDVRTDNDHVSFCLSQWLFGYCQVVSGTWS